MPGYAPAKMSSPEKDFQERSHRQMYKTSDPLEKLRLACLMRGNNGIKQFGKSFKIFDDDGNRMLSKSEFHKGVNDYGAGLSDEEVDTLFVRFDRDGGGSVDFDEFLINLRPPMSKSRVDIINQAFDKMDKTGDGVITEDDLKGVYNVRNHPKFTNGEWSEKKVFEEFLKNFETDKVDGRVTRDEFTNYYSGVSASIDSDAYFDLMMRQAWKL